MIQDADSSINGNMYTVKIDDCNNYKRQAGTKTHQIQLAEQHVVITKNIKVVQNVNLSILLSLIQ